MCCVNMLTYFAQILEFLTSVSCEDFMFHVTFWLGSKHENCSWVYAFFLVTAAVLFAKVVVSILAKIIKCVCSFVSRKLFGRGGYRSWRRRNKHIRLQGLYSPKKGVYMRQKFGTKYVSMKNDAKCIDAIAGKHCKNANAKQQSVSKAKAKRLIRKAYAAGRTAKMDESLKNPTMLKKKECQADEKSVCEGRKLQYLVPKADTAKKATAQTPHARRQPSFIRGDIEIDPEKCKGFFSRGSITYRASTGEGEPNKITLKLDEEMSRRIRGIIRNSRGSMGMKKVFPISEENVKWLTAGCCLAFAAVTIARLQRN